MSSPGTRVRGVRRRGAWCWVYGQKSVKRLRQGPPSQPAKGYRSAWRWEVPRGLMPSRLAEPGRSPLSHRPASSNLQDPTCWDLRWGLWLLLQHKMKSGKAERWVQTTKVSEGPLPEDCFPPLTAGRQNASLPNSCSEKRPCCPGL